MNLLLQNGGHAEVLKKTPSSAKYVPPPPPPPPPGFSGLYLYVCLPCWICTYCAFRRGRFHTVQHGLVRKLQEYWDILRGIPRKVQKSSNRHYTSVSDADNVSRNNW